MKAELESLRKDHVFITSIVRCRPPENRVPTAREQELCMPYLSRQIKLIDPKILVLLGSTALKALMGKDMKITKIRGQWLDWNDRQVIPVYHPAALLRTPSLKKETWEDFQKIVDKYRQVVNPEHQSKKTYDRQIRLLKLVRCC